MPDGRPGIDIAIPSFGHKSDNYFCRRFGFIRKSKGTEGTRFDRWMLREDMTSDNNPSDVWPDTAYPRQASEAWLMRQGRVSRIHRKRAQGKPVLERTAQANAFKSKVRASVEHEFALQMTQMVLFIRTIRTHSAPQHPEFRRSSSPSTLDTVLKRMGPRANAG